MIVIKMVLSMLIFILIVSCNGRYKSSNSINNNDSILNNHPEGLLENPDKITSKKEKEITDISEQKIEILCPISYRIIDNQDPTKSMNENWLELHSLNDTFYLDKAEFRITEGVDDCTGYPTKYIETERNTLIFLNLLDQKRGPIPSCEILKNKIWPNDQMEITLNNKVYQLRAEGNILSSEPIATNSDEPEIWHEVSDYKLYFKAENGDEILLFDIRNFEYSFVELIFAGDIDGDNELDLIFNNSLHYEETRVTLFLSSFSKKKNSIKKAAEISASHDC